MTPQNLQPGDWPRGDKFQPAVAGCSGSDDLAGVAVDGHFQGCLGLEYLVGGFEIGMDCSGTGLHRPALHNNQGTIGGHLPAIWQQEVGDA